jgi:hypothetical protein
LTHGYKKKVGIATHMKDFFWKKKSKFAIFQGKIKDEIAKFRP